MLQPGNVRALGNYGNALLAHAKLKKAMAEEAAVQAAPTGPQQAAALAAAQQRLAADVQEMLLLAGAVWAGTGGAVGSGCACMRGGRPRMRAYGQRLDHCLSSCLPEPLSAAAPAPALRCLRPALATPLSHCQHAPMSTPLYPSTHPRFRRRPQVPGGAGGQARRCQGLHQLGACGGAAGRHGAGSRWVGGVGGGGGGGALWAGACWGASVRRLPPSVWRSRFPLLLPVSPHLTYLMWSGAPPTAGDAAEGASLFLLASDKFSAAIDLQPEVGGRAGGRKRGRLGCGIGREVAQLQG